MSETILIIIALLSMFVTYCLYKIFDKNGLYYAIIILNIIGFILSFKIVAVFKLNINLGIIVFISSLIDLYIFTIKFGKKEINNIIKQTLYSNVIILLLIILTNYFIPTITETISINMKGTFEYNYKILAFYPFIVLISQYLAIKLFTLVTKIQDNIFVSIILTYIITAVLYTIIFSVISYINILTVRESIFIGISTYIFGIIITIINTIYVYLFTGKKVKK